MLFAKRRQSSFESAVGWVKRNMVEGKGIIVHSRQRVPYPEVTGYFLPTLYEWGEASLARTCTDWLLSIQMPDGAFPAPDGVPYTFDTAQVIRGLCAAHTQGHVVEGPIRKACDWMLTQIGEGGRLNTPSTALWGDIANDLIHIYAVFPLISAGRLLAEPTYVDAGRYVQAYYTAQTDLVALCDEIP